MSKCEFQSYIREQAKDFSFADSKLVKTINGPNGKQFKIYDQQWYQNELNKFELFVEGELVVGSIKITREYMPVKDRFARDDTYKGFDHFCYYTKIVDTSIQSSDIVASIGLIHGFI